MRNRSVHPLLLGFFVVVLVAALLRGYLTLSPPQLQESDLRETTGIEIETTASIDRPHVVVVDCQIKNQSDRMARSVVFSVRLVGTENRLLAANPLGNTRDLVPGEVRSVQLSVPISSDLPKEFQIRAAVDLVRWDDVP